MDISVVLVTFNRLDCLKLSLKQFSSQSYKPKRIIVVNNCSTDGTDDFLAQWEEEIESFEKIVIKTEKNLGGAGGFATGLNKASEFTDTDWIWLSDDDAYLVPDTLKKLKDVYESSLKNEEISALFTSVVNKGKFDLDHRRVVKKSITGVRFIPVPEENYSKPFFEIHQGSYVGMLVKSELIRKHGITRDDLFIYYDDTEHCERLRKFGKLICIPSSIVNHDVFADSSFSWKSYYGSRNSTILISDYYGKYYAYMNVLKRYLKYVSPFSKNSKRIKRMLKAGLRDGLAGKTGLHDEYKPGWQVEE